MPLYQWLSTFQMLQSFKTVPHVVVRNHTIISLRLASGHQLHASLCTAGWHQALTSRAGLLRVAAEHLAVRIERFMWQGRDPEKWRNGAAPEELTGRLSLGRRLWPPACCKQPEPEDRQVDLPLTFDESYPIGRLMMCWVEREIIWKCSWKRWEKSGGNLGSYSWSP